MLPVRAGVLRALVKEISVDAGKPLVVGGARELAAVLRLEQAYGLEIDPRERLPEIAAVLAAGVGMRALTRELLDLVPVAGWAVKGAVAYAGTRALGEAAVQWFGARHPAGDAGPTPRPGATSPAAP